MLLSLGHAFCSCLWQIYEEYIIYFEVPCVHYVFLQSFEADDSFFSDKKKVNHLLIIYSLLTFTFSIQCYETCWRLPLL